jgi:hypothetical protein
MVPANPISETTNPKPWQAVTDMMGYCVDSELHCTKDTTVLRALGAGMKFSQRDWCTRHEWAR